MGDKNGWYHGGIPDNYPDDALDLKTIYMSMQAGKEGVLVFWLHFPIQRGLIS
jgi:hypothetical protein